jgi:hypothetical protein
LPLTRQWPAQGLDFFGGQRLSPEEALPAAEALAEDENDRIVFLSDVWLDKPDTLDRLKLVFEGALAQPMLLIHTSACAPRLPVA